jgi:hypothetical protein
MTLAHEFETSPGNMLRSCLTKMKNLRKSEITERLKTPQRQCNDDKMKVNFENFTVVTQCN